MTTKLGVTTYDPLYKRTSSGKVQIWQIAVLPQSDGTAVIRIEHGQVDGKKQVTEDHITKGKNAGRKNATTPLEQAISEAEARWLKQRDRKRYGMTVDESENKIALAPMLACKFEDFADRVDWSTAIAQPKLDGNRCLARYARNGVELITRQGLSVVTTPHIIEVLEDIMVPGQTLDGELYLHGHSVTKLNSLLRREQPESADVEFHVYDMVSPLPYTERLMMLKEVQRVRSAKVTLVASQRLYTAADLMTWQADCIRCGYEGAMLRHGQKGYEPGKRSSSLLKVKTFLDEEFPIVKVSEGRGSHRGMAIFTCRTKQGNEFEVTAPGSHDEKRMAWENRDTYIGKRVTVKFQCWTDTAKRVPFHAVAKCIVDE